VGAALLALALGPCAGVALAAPATSGFIVATATSGALAEQAPQAGAAQTTATDGLGRRLASLLPEGTAPDGRPAETVDTGSSFDMLGILFRSTPAGARDVVFRVRVSRDGLSWTPWFYVKADIDSGPGGSVLSKADLVTEPVWVGPARYVQYEACDAEGAPVSDVRLACVEADVSSPVDARGSAAVNVPASTTALGSSVPAPLGMPLEPKIVSRAGWGADESLRSGSPLYGEVRCAFVHHTVNGNTYSRSQAPALVRDIYYYHTRVNGWNDIDYNFLIDRFGTIYEGRYGGVAKAVIGAQVLGFNSMSTGVAMIGTFDTVAPSKAALSSLEHLLAWKLDLSHLNPLGTACALCQTTQKYRAGQWVSLPVISGHRQVNYTDCPGTVLFGMLPSIRTAVAGIGDPKIYSPTATPAAFSPNGDGVRDTVLLHAGLSSVDAWTITLSDASGAVVARFSGIGQVASAVWNGRDATGKRVPDGAYVASFAASDANGTARPAKAVVRIDTVSPQFTGLTASPTVVSPNGDRFADSAALDFGLSETSGVGLTVLDANGTVVRTVAAVTEAAGSRRLVWDGKVSSGGALAAAPDGAYQVVLRATDAAGNHSTASVAVTVDDTLGHPRLSPIWISPNGDGVTDAGLLTFRTTRGARLNVTVATSGGAVVRRALLGSLASGAHTWRWDGLNTVGAEVADGTYRCTLSAANAIGTVAVTLTWHVDTAPPSAAWRSAPLSTKLGKTVNATYRVGDNLSPRAFVAIVAITASGAKVASSSPTVKTATTLGWSFTPKARGTYTVRLRATDLAGNVQATPATFVVKVT
jgi:flagellar hook assembly protein FlgD